MLKKNIYIVLLMVFILSLSFNKKILSFSELFKEIPFNEKIMINAFPGRIFTSGRFIAEAYGFSTSWFAQIDLNDIDVDIEIRENFNAEGRIVYSGGKEFAEDNSESNWRVISVLLLTDKKDPSKRYQLYTINGQDYYFITQTLDDSKKTYTSIRAFFEPFFEVSWNKEKQSVQLYRNPSYHRFKLDPLAKTIIHNYKLHTFQSSFSQPSPLHYIPVREFFSLMNVQLNWVYDTQLKANYVQITSQTTSKQILLYPTLNKALIQAEDQLSQEMVLKNKFVIEKQALFIDAEDLIQLLRAERYYYNDLYNDLYFNAEF